MCSNVKLRNNSFIWLHYYYHLVTHYCYEKRRENVSYVFAVYDGIIQETYKVLNWFESGSTYSNRVDIERWKKNVRWEFVGNISKEMRKKYQYKSVAHYWTPGNRNPIRYTF